MNVLINRADAVDVASVGLRRRLRFNQWFVVDWRDHPTILTELEAAYHIREQTPNSFRQD